MAKKKQDLRKLSKLRKEEAVRKEFAEDAEILLTVGQESEKKAAKYVDETAKEIEKDDAQDKAHSLEELSKLRRLPKIFSYKEKLCIQMANIVKEGGVPRGFGFEATIEDKGVGLSVFKQDARGTPVRLGSRRFAISGEPEIDYNYIWTLSEWAYRLMNNDETQNVTPGGIVIPK